MTVIGRILRNLEASWKYAGSRYALAFAFQPQVSVMKKQFVSALVFSAILAPAALTAPAAALTTPDREAVELIAPEYPRGAERRGIEGTVRVEYSIAATGEVVNARVVEADPAGVFDRAALAAIESWRYAPAADQTDGHSRELEFRLSN
jgi:periplasmic protein TonB